MSWFKKSKKAEDTKADRLVARMTSKIVKEVQAEMQELLDEQQKSEESGTSSILLYSKGAIEKVQGSVSRALTNSADYIKNGVKDTIAHGEMREVRQAVERLARLQEQEGQTNEALIRIMKEKGIGQDEIDAMVEAVSKEMSNGTNGKVVDINPADKL